MHTARILRNRKQRPEPGRRPADPVRRRPVPLADLLDLRRRAAADRRSDARRLRDGGFAVPVRRHDRLHDPAPARVPRGRARARTGDAGGRGAPARARPRRCARTATTASSATSCAARAACASSRSAASNCSRPLDQAWTICPYCETEVARRAGAPHAPPPHAGLDRRRAGRAGDGATRPETARAKAARERKEREAGRSSTQTSSTPRTPTTSDDARRRRSAASEPAPRARGTAVARQRAPARTLEHLTHIRNQQRNPWTER